MFKKIYKILLLFTLSVFFLCMVAKDNTYVLSAIFVLILLLCGILAKEITKSIVEPINEIDLTKEIPHDVYNELVPFLDKVSKQNHEIKKRLIELEKQNLTLKTISDSMSEGLVILDKDMNIVSANDSILRIFGGEKNTIQGSPIKSLSQDEEFLKNIAKTYRGGASSGVFQFGEKSYRVFCSPVFSDDLPVGAVLLFFDVSSDIQSAKIRREFSANVSHELKTPLTSILGYSQIINGGIAKENDILKFTQKIEKEASRLISLINDIIQLSKLDEDKVPEEKENILILPLIEEIAESLDVKAREKDVTISTDGDNSVIFGNKAQISELVYNLIENGIKYNKQGGEVKVRVFKKTLKVSDTGIGIPERYLERVFERFFRVDKSHSKQVSGTGLGLSIVKHIAIQNNAEISVESTEGVGSTFTVEF